MKAVFVLFDSLNRHLLGSYGGSRFPTPNFDRLAARSMQYDRHYVGSLPCMPARRDMQTGRLSFLHRSWGPLEPFDNSFPELLSKSGVYTHLVTDHYHYWEDGGATYHNRYDSYEFVRGQEADAWKAMVQPPWERFREMYHASQYAEQGKYKHYMINREHIREEEDFPSVRCFEHGFEFLDQNRDADNWLLQVETFDPHEPFHAPERFKKPFDTGYNGPILDWPRYGKVEELPAEADELRSNYYATVCLCDHLLGKMLDYFDRHDLWRDTALVVTTDHGFLLGEHDFWAKNRMNMYEEIVHIPLFVHDPRRPGRGRSNALTQTMDIAPTFLEMFDVPVPEEMEGLALNGAGKRDAVIFGYFGGAVNVTDGDYSYHRYPLDVRAAELYQYTLMPSHLNQRFTPEELSTATLQEPFGFSKRTPLLKIPVIERSPMYFNYGPGALLENETRLYDLVGDPGQETPIDEPATEAHFARAMAALMAANEAPGEAFARLGLEHP